MHPSYTTSWHLTEQLKGLLTCLAISPNGTKLVAASSNKDLLLIDASDGSILVSLSLEGQFTILSALWYCETNVAVGCTNGSMYDVCFAPKNNKYSVTVSPFLTTFTQQIGSLAYDPTGHVLAVGYGNTVALFAHYESKWEMLELIKGPCNNPSGLVHALLFYPTTTGHRSLLIGYAELGWNIWSHNTFGTSVRRISPDMNHNVCRIGRAALTTDEKSIAVSTLDHSIAIYTLADDGPVLASMREFPYSEGSGYAPVVPIASTADGLTLGGTPHGELPMVENNGTEVSLMHHDNSDHLIRAIATHGQKIFVGSSSEKYSTLKCYSASPVARGNVLTVNSPTFIDISEAFTGWEGDDSKWGV
ncbi:hypothetical protein FRC06_003830, partial [Ceratobasidium sp. 370]